MCTAAVPLLRCLPTAEAAPVAVPGSLCPPKGSPYRVYASVCLLTACRWSQLHARDPRSKQLTASELRGQQTLLEMFGRPWISLLPGGGEPLPAPVVNACVVSHNAQIETCKLSTGHSSEYDWVLKDSTFGIIDIFLWITSPPLPIFPGTVEHVADGTSNRRRDTAVTGAARD